MTNALSVLLVDDEAPARARMRSLLEDCAEEVPTELVGEAASGPEALALLASRRVDVVLLDISMPGMDGIEVARHISAQSTPARVIFVTAYDAHAVSAFEVGARDYLLKPVKLARLVEALKRVSQRPAPESTAASEHITVSDRGRVIRVPLDEVLYLRAELKYVTLKTRDREYVLDDTLAHLEDVHGGRLVRIHRNCLVNQAHLAGFRLQRDGEETHWVALLKDWPETLPVSRRQAHVVKAYRTS